MQSHCWSTSRVSWTITLTTLCGEAFTTNLPMGFISLCFAMYCGRRRVRACKVVVTAQGINNGCTFAKTLVRVLLRRTASERKWSRLLLISHGHPSALQCLAKHQCGRHHRQQAQGQLQTDAQTEFHRTCRALVSGLAAELASRSTEHCWRPIAHS